MTLYYMKVYVLYSAGSGSDIVGVFTDKDKAYENERKLNSHLNRGSEWFCPLFFTVEEVLLDDSTYADDYFL